MPQSTDSNSMTKDHLTDAVAVLLSSQHSVELIPAAIYNDDPFVGTVFYVKPDNTVHADRLMLGTVPGLFDQMKAISE